jgi:hypothetical protein
MHAVKTWDIHAFCEQTGSCTGFVAAHQVSLSYASQEQLTLKYTAGLTTNNLQLNQISNLVKLCYNNAGTILFFYI